MAKIKNIIAERRVLPTSAYALYINKTSKIQRKRYEPQAVENYCNCAHFALLCAL